MSGAFEQRAMAAVWPTVAGPDVHLATVMQRALQERLLKIVGSGHQPTNARRRSSVTVSQDAQIWCFQHLKLMDGMQDLLLEKDRQRRQLGLAT